MSECQKIPKRVQRIVEACKTGSRLHMFIRRSEIGHDEYVYWLEPSGRTVGPKSVEKAIEMGLIEPCGDTLFDGIGSQTYTAT